MAANSENFSVQPPSLLLHVASLQPTQASASATRDIAECVAWDAAPSLQSQPHVVAKPAVADLQGDDSDSSEDVTTYIFRSFTRKNTSAALGMVLVNPCDPIDASVRPTRSAEPSSSTAELATPSKQRRCDIATSAAGASTDGAAT